MDSSEKWYSVKEVSARFGVSCDSVRRWIKRGKTAGVQDALIIFEAEANFRVLPSFRKRAGSVHPSQHDFLKGGPGDEPGLFSFIMERGRAGRVVDGSGLENRHT